MQAVSLRTRWAAGAECLEHACNHAEAARTRSAAAARAAAAPSQLRRSLDTHDPTAPPAGSSQQAQQQRQQQRSGPTAVRSGSSRRLAPPCAAQQGGGGGFGEAAKRFAKQVQGGLPVIGLISRWASTEGGVGNDAQVRGGPQTA